MRVFLLPILALCLWLAPSGAMAEESGKQERAAIAVIDFDYVDTSGEERDQSKEHEARLAAFMSALRRDLANSERFRLVSPVCTPGPCLLAGPAISDLVVAAREAGADLLLIGGVHKLSTLVQNAGIDAIDAKTGKAIFHRLFTFRGDTDDAWRRAEMFIFDEIADVSGRPASR
jgi:Protein of unknown function (DUF2380).